MLGRTSNKLNSLWKDAQFFPALWVIAERMGLPAEGLEPTRSCDHWILSPARLPIPPRRRRKPEATKPAAKLKRFQRDHSVPVDEDQAPGNGIAPSSPPRIGPMADTQNHAICVYDPVPPKNSIDTSGELVCKIGPRQVV
jgi:hypothetical protein